MAKAWHLFPKQVFALNAWQSSIVMRNMGMVSLIGYIQNIKMFFFAYPETRSLCTAR